MIGAVIVTHGDLANSLLDVVKTITGKSDNIKTVLVKSNDTTEHIRDAITNAIKKVRTDDGVIIFTDMFGGTPSNIALAFIVEGEVEVITGINLPMLLKFINYREKTPISELVVLLKEQGREGIVLASEMLRSKQ